MTRNTTEMTRPSKHSRSSFEPTGKMATGKLSYCVAPNTANANDLSVLSRNSNTRTFNICHQFNVSAPLTCVYVPAYTAYSVYCVCYKKAVIVKI